MSKRKHIKLDSFSKDEFDGFYFTNADSYFVTESARTSGWTKEGKEYLDQVNNFCSCVRTIVDSTLNDKVITKPEIQGKYDLNSRLFNSAQVTALGNVKSLQKCAFNYWENMKVKFHIALENHKTAIFNALPDWVVKSKWKRVLKWDKKVKEAWYNLSRPNYFPGRSVFLNQDNLSKKEFEKQYDYARNNHIVSIGEWSEDPCCNSELQIKFAGYDRESVITKDFTNVKYIFEVIHSRKKLCQFKLPRKEGSVLLERLLQNGVEYEWEERGRKLTKKELEAFPSSFIGPLGIGCIAKVPKPYYIPLTVAFIRDFKKPTRWQIRISWAVSKKESYNVTDTFLGYDINNDSIAYLLFKINDGKITVIDKGEIKFEIKAKNSKERKGELHRILNLMFEVASKHKACVLGESLNWENAKLGFSKMSGMLHAIPYRQIRDAVIRKGLKKGVPTRFINPKNTSLLGGLFTELNRDIGASLVIGLKGDLTGIAFLEALCKEFLMTALVSEGIPYKVEVKNQSSEIVKIRVRSRLLLSNRDNTKDIRTPFTNELSLILGDVTRHWKQLNYKNRKVHIKLDPVIFLEDIPPTARRYLGVCPVLSKTTASG